MTDETTDEVEPSEAAVTTVEAEETDAEETLVARHRRLKEEATRVLHNYGDDRGHCAAFDEVLEQVGLPARPRYYQSLGTEAPPVEVEATEQEFERWRLTTSRVLSDAARHHGITGSNEILSRAGLLTRSEVYRHVEAVVTGTFRVTVDVEIPVGDDLIDHVRTRTVREKVYDQFGTDAVTWKATVDEPNAEPTPERATEMAEAIAREVENEDVKPS